MLRLSKGRIAHVLPWVSIGGTELQTRRLAQAADELGYSNIIYVPAGADKTRTLFREAGFNVFEYEQVQPSYSKPNRFVKASRELAASLRKNNIQVLHYADVLAAHFTGVAGRLARAKVISHVRNHYPHFPLRDKTFLMAVERFIFVSKNTRDSFGIVRARARSRVLYDLPGAVFKPLEDRENARSNFGLPRDSHVFGMAARVSPQKDFPTLIRAAAIVTEKLPNCAFLIAGDYQAEPAHRSHFESLQPLLRDSRMCDRFFFAGFQPEMSPFYAAIDTFVLSSNWEGLATTILEAMMYRRPVVSTNVGGISEAIEDGVNGFLAPPKSPELFAQRLLQIATDCSLAKSMVENAERSLNEKFGQTRFVEQVDQLYSDLLFK
jgi:glycosyltransferase involved in cell wall biosynthesis